MEQEAVSFEAEPQADGIVDSSASNTEARARSLANLRPWKKGQVPNPRGRPKKDFEAAAEAQKHGKQAIQTLVRLMGEDNKPGIRLAAAAQILDRGFGKAPQSLDVKHTLSIGEEFDAFIRKLQGIDDDRAPLAIEAEAVDVSEENNNPSEQGSD